MQAVEQQRRRYRIRTIVEGEGNQPLPAARTVVQQHVDSRSKRGVQERVRVGGTQNVRRDELGAGATIQPRCRPTKDEQRSDQRRRDYFEDVGRGFADSDISEAA